MLGTLSLRFSRSGYSGLGIRSVHPHRSVPVSTRVGLSGGRRHCPSVRARRAIRRAARCHLGPPLWPPPHRAHRLVSSFRCRMRVPNRFCFAGLAATKNGRELCSGDVDHIRPIKSSAGRSGMTYVDVSSPAPKLVAPMSQIAQAGKRICEERPLFASFSQGSRQPRIVRRGVALSHLCMAISRRAQGEVPGFHPQRLHVGGIGS